MDASLRDWAGLPVHIVDSIVSVLGGFFNYVRFSSVCTQWRSVAFEADLDNKVKLEILKGTHKKLPMLMFTTDENYESWSLYSVQEEKTYNVKLPMPYKYRFVGSSCGWLFCLDKKTLVVTLVNPSNNRCISLPAFTAYDFFKSEWRKKYFDYYIMKAILFSDPNTSTCGFVVVVIYGGSDEVAFFKAGDTSWNFMNSGTNIPAPSSSKNFTSANDIIYYKGKLYAVGVASELVEIDITTKTKKTIIPANYSSWSDAAYLVESQEGELLMVQRYSSPIVLDPVPYNEGEAMGDEEVLDIDEDLAAYSSLEDESISSSDSEVGPLDRQKILDYTDGDLSMSSNFKVFKMSCQSDEETSATSWVELSNIGKQALFVGDNHSVSVSTVEFPKCVDNYIYYTSQDHRCVLPYVYRRDYDDSFVFDLEGKGIYNHHKLDDSSKYLQPPIWYVPNPEEINFGT